jgi:hypothetical protein
MIKFLGKYKYILLTFLIAFILFYPSLFTFFTNDDFFFLNIAKANSLGEFFNFFSLSKGPEGFGMYRPLTTQVFYFLSRSLFNLSPLPLHIISLIFFFGVIYLVYRLVVELVKNEKVAILSAFLYAVSATHFGQLYYLAAFQELGMTLFVILSCLMFIKRKNLLSFIFFVLALMSKETAVVTPILLALIYFFQKFNGEKIISFKRFIVLLSPYLILLATYFVFRFASYGFATGDSYIWDFSLRKLINTSFWYLLWSFNIPESLVDFIGSGLTINPNLFVFWGDQIKPILILFIVQALILIYVLFRSIVKNDGKNKNANSFVSALCIAWFFVSLLPVIFLPLHKFTFYLTLPLIAVTFRIAYLLITTKVNRIVIGIFLLVWTITSVLTLKFTYVTNWISQSQIISQRVFEFFNSEGSKLEGKTIAFVDTEDDSNVFWSPTSTIRTVLSDKNFFDVFFPNLADKIDYNGQGEIKIKSRQFLGY